MISTLIFHWFQCIISGKIYCRCWFLLCVYRRESTPLIILLFVLPICFTYLKLVNKHWIGKKNMKVNTSNIMDDEFVGNTKYVKWHQWVENIHKIEQSNRMNSNYRHEVIKTMPLLLSGNNRQIDKLCFHNVWTRYAF